MAEESKYNYNWQNSEIKNVSGILSERDLELLQELQKLSDDELENFFHGLFQIYQVPYLVRFQTCKREGHIFSKWETRELSQDEKFEIFGSAMLRHTRYSRTCKRCQFEEIVIDKKPIELEQEEIREKRKKRIRELRVELEQLEKEENN